MSIVVAALGTWSCGSSPPAPVASGGSPEPASTLVPSCQDVAFAEPCWLKARNASCHVWNPAPQPGEWAEYRGACKGGVADGAGQLTWSSGGDSQGTFAKGQIVQGTHTYADGRREIGRFDGPRFEGLSVEADGRYLMGTQDHGKLFGPVKTRLADGTFIEATYVDGLPEGPAKELSAQGSVVRANHRAGKSEGPAVETDEMGFEVRSEFVDGERRNTTYFIPDVDGKKQVSEAEYRRVRDQRYYPVPAWHFRGRLRGVDGLFVSFRISGKSASGLFDQLGTGSNMAEVRHAAPTYQDRAAGDMQASAPTWYRVSASTSPRPGSTWFQVDCYRWTRSGMPPDFSDPLDVCRVDVGIGTVGEKGQVTLGYQDDPDRWVILVEDRVAEQPARSLYDTMDAAFEETLDQGNKVRSKFIRDTRNRWEIWCREQYELAPILGRSPCTCNMKLTAPHVTAEGPSWNADGVRIEK